MTFTASLRELAAAAHVNEPGAEFADWLAGYREAAAMLGISAADDDQLPERVADHLHILLRSWGEDEDYAASMAFFRTGCGCDLCQRAVANNW